MALTSPDCRFLRVNRALCQITGYTAQQLEGLPVASITHPDDLKADWEARGAMLEGELSSHRAERRYLHASGSAVWVAVNSTLVRDADGKPLHFLSQMQDVTERRRYEAELRHLADHDPLTGLLNRRSFERELERHVAYVARYGADGRARRARPRPLQDVNDTLGHSRRRRADRARRPRAAQPPARVRRARPPRRRRVRRPAARGRRPRRPTRSPPPCSTPCARSRVPTATGRTRTVTASLGVALFDSAEQLTGEDVLVNADLAMYDAKEAGRDQLASYDAPRAARDRASRRASRGRT